MSLKHAWHGDFFFLLFCFVFGNDRGSGEDGQLGIGNKEEKEWVCVVQALEPYKVRSVVAGSRNSLAICDDGKVSFSFFFVFFFFLVSSAMYNKLLWLCVLIYVCSWF